MGQNHVAEKFHSIEIKSSMTLRRFCSPLLLIWSQASPPLLSHVSFNITVKTHGREEAHFLIALAKSLFGGTKVKLCQFLNAKVSHGLIHCCYHFIPRQRHKKGRCETLHYCRCVPPLILELNISETSECANIRAAVARCEGLTRVRAVFVLQLIGPPPRMWLLTKQSYPTPVVLTGCGTLSSQNGLLPQPLALSLS